MSTITTSVAAIGPIPPRTPAAEACAITENEEHSRLELLLKTSECCPVGES